MAKPDSKAKSKGTPGIPFLDGGGEMGALMRAHDWSRTPLGPPAAWPQSLRSAVSILLPSKAQIALFWGAELITLYNDAYRPVFGAKHPRALGMPAREAWSEIWESGLRELFDGVLRTGEAYWAKDRPFMLERHGVPEETVFDVSYDPVRDETGAVGGLFCIVSETTGRVLGERRLKTLRDLATRSANAKNPVEACALIGASLADNPHDLPFALIFLEDGKHAAPHLAAATPAAEALSDADRWPLREALRNPAIGVTPIDPATPGVPAGAWPRPPSSAAIVPIPASGQAGRAAVLVAGLNPFRPFDEDYRTFLELAARQISAAIGNACAYEEERKRAESLAELDRAKTAFFSNVSHEFRTPLTLMLGPVQDILEKPHAGQPPESRELLEVVHRNGLRLLKLVNALLDFARIEAGRAQASYDEVDLAALTADLASNFRAACERTGLRLDVDCPPLTQVACVDREMWEKIVLNLLSNAFKFTLHGGITVRTREAAKAYTLTVSDTGTGVPASELPRMFERFHRVEGARGRSHEGSGIGLALVQELVRLHGGTIAVESVHGQGTTFTVSIPKGSDHLPTDQIKAQRGAVSTTVRAGAYVAEALSWLPGADTTGPQARSASGRRFLLADDNADLREYARRLLSEEYEVEAVADGLAALTAARARRPDLIVSDVMMPGLDGFGLVRALRADPALLDVPVILLSARAGEEARMEGLGKGADDYLVKPFSARELLVRAGGLLHAAQVRRTALEEQQRAASELRDKVEELEAILRSVPVGVFIAHDASCSNITMNPAGAAILRMPEGSNSSKTAPVTGQLPFRVLKAGVELGNDNLPMQRACRMGQPVIGEEIEIVFDDGTSTTLFEHAVPLLDAVGKTRGCVGVFVDITDRKRAEQMLHEEARTLETLNRVGRALTAETELEPIVQTATDAATAVSGAEFGAFFYNVANEAGQSFMLFTLSGAPREAFEKFGMPRNTAVFSATFSGGPPVRVDDITRDPRYGKNAPHQGMPKGHPPVRSYLAVPVVSRSGEVIGGLFFGHSRPGVFTARAEQLVSGIASQAAVAIDNARLHEQRKQLIDQLREADRRKDEFLATLSHELRNPLAPLRNSLHLLQMSGKADAESTPIHEMMERQVNHLVRLVDDLLEVSRISRGAFELRRERVSVAAIVRNALETSDPLVKAAGHEMSVTLPEEPLWIDGDPVRLAQILANILNNAAKYTGRGGRIAVDAKQDGSTVAITVRDNGPGIASEALPRIFQMFSRGQDSSSPGDGGLGIGLSLAQRLAEMHGGSIKAHSEGLGKGAEFTVTLPLASGTAPGAAAGGDAAGFISPKRILVVDDNLDAATSLGMILRFLGADVRIARDGPEALQAYGPYDPAVVLLDIGLPGLDGYEVARRMRAGYPERRSAIVALTGWGQEGDRRKAREAGFDHHLVKPADINALKSLLASL